MINQEKYWKKILLFKKRDMTTTSFYQRDQCFQSPKLSFKKILDVACLFFGFAFLCVKNKEKF